MVSVVPPTAVGAVRTVADAAAGLAEGVLLADEPPADTAVTPPTAATTARPIPAMMIFGCRTVSSWLFDDPLSTNTDSRAAWFTWRADGHRPDRPGADIGHNRLRASGIPGEPRGTASRATNPAATATGSSHRRHGAVLAWPPGPGWDMPITMLLRGTRRHLGWVWVAGARRAGGSPGRPGGGLVSRRGCIRVPAARQAGAPQPGSRRGCVPARR